ncbi:MAG: ankyrin repeat domain-containing protein [Pseudomonadota bacterium]
MTPDSDNRVKIHQRTAERAALTAIGATVLLMVCAVFAPKQGMEAMVLLIPMYVAFLVHVVCTLIALIAARRSGRHTRNAWIYSYFFIFWSVCGYYFVTVNALDVAAHRLLHEATRSADTALYRIVTQSSYATSGGASFGPAQRERALSLIRDGADVNYTPPGRGVPMISMAARSGDPVLVAALLDHGAAVPAPGTGVWTPLMAATTGDHPAAVTLLIQRGSRPDDPAYNSVTPLSEAVQNGRHRVAEALLEGGANPDFHARDSAPPLIIAATRGDGAMVKLLLDAGADPNRIVFGQTTAMLRAVEKGCIDCVAHLAAAGWRPVGRDRSGRSALALAMAGGQDAMFEQMLTAATSGDAGMPNERFTEDLLEAGRLAAWDMMRRLVASAPKRSGILDSALLSVVGRRYREPLMSPSAEILTARAIIENGADINAVDNRGYTVLMCAAESGADGLVRLLIAQGARVAATATDGHSALSLAVWKKHPAVAEILLQASADLSTGASSYQLLMDAVSSQNPGMVKLLLDAGGKIPSAEDRISLFERAAKSPETLRLLAGAVADLDVQDRYRGSPLSVVVKRGSAESMRVMIDAGAQPWEEGGRGFNAFQWFAENGNADLLHRCLTRHPELRTDSERMRQAMYRAIRSGQVDAVRTLLGYATVYSRMAEVNAILEWTTAPPGHPDARVEIRRLFAERLVDNGAATASARSTAILVVVPKKSEGQ